MHTVPACDIRLRPYWHAGSCQEALAIYRRLGGRRLSPGTSRPCPRPAAAGIIVSPVHIVASRPQRFACSLHGSQAGFPKQMTYNFTRSTSRTVERRTKRPSTGDTFLGRARAWGSSSFFQVRRQPHLFVMTMTVARETHEVSTVSFEHSCKAFWHIRAHKRRRSDFLSASFTSWYTAAARLGHPPTEPCSLHEIGPMRHS